MPLTSAKNSSDQIAAGGKLFVVGTPIGNTDDITLRALNTLKKVDLVAAEDTRLTGRFLSRHGIRVPLVSYHEHNENKRTADLIQRLRAGISIALLSSAGTPTVSDPGYRLIEAAISSGVPVVPIPGVSAAITALSVAGLATDSFVFVGFLTKKRGKRLKQLQALAAEIPTLVFYESPRRILALLEDIAEIMGDRNAVLCREMTKLHEEFIRGAVSDIANVLSGRAVIKGECTLLVEGREKEEKVSFEVVEQQIRKALKSKNTSLTGMSKEIAKKYGVPKNRIYKEALKIKEAEKKGP